MNEILEEISERLIESVIEPDKKDIADVLKYLIPDDFLNFLNRQPKAADSPSEETLSLETLRRNMNRNKEIS